MLTASRRNENGVAWTKQKSSGRPSKVLTVDKKLSFTHLLRSKF